MDAGISGIIHIIIPAFRGRDMIKKVIYFILVFSMILILFYMNTTETHAAVSSTATYTLTFNEHGLPHNASWSVTIGNKTYKSWTNVIVYSGYGNTSYKINAPKGFISNFVSGTVNLIDNITINITFSAKYPGIIFVEYNLPMNFTWSVTLGNHTIKTNDTYIYFMNITGGFWYKAMANASIYRQVNGFIYYKNITEIYINFTKAIYEVIFVPSGTPAYQQISVTINNQTQTGTYVIFYLPNGTYNYTVSQVPGYSTSMSSGVVIVSGTTITIIPFTQNEFLYQQTQNEVAALTVIAAGILALVIYLAKGRRRVR
jgi:hypothetical protein